MMAVAGVGIEIVSVDSLPDPRTDPSFYLSLLPQSDFDYCMTHADPTLHLAGRIAARRAAAKALRLVGISSDDMEIDRAENGEIHLRVRGLPPGIKVHLSITHDTPIAIAIVIVESE